MDNLYGYKMLRPEWTCQIQGPSGEELKRIRYARLMSNIKYYAHQSAIIALMLISFSICLVTISKLMANG